LDNEFFLLLWYCLTTVKVQSISNKVSEVTSKMTVSINAAALGNDTIMFHFVT